MINFLIGFCCGAIFILLVWLAVLTRLENQHKNGGGQISGTAAPHFTFATANPDWVDWPEWRGTTPPPKPEDAKRSVAPRPVVVHLHEYKGKNDDIAN